MEFQIEPMAMKHYDQVIALWRTCEGIGLSDADSRDNVRTYLFRNPGLSYVVIAKMRVVAAVFCGHDGRRGYLNHLAVHRDYRRQGLGRSLVKKCLATLDTIGIAKCHLFIFRKNSDNARFWEHMGWELRSDLRVASKYTGNSVASDDRALSGGTLL